MLQLGQNGSPRIEVEKKGLLSNRSVTFKIGMVMFPFNNYFNQKARFFILRLIGIKS